MHDSDEHPTHLRYANRDTSTRMPLVLRLTLCVLVIGVFFGGMFTLIGSVAMIKDGHAIGWLVLIVSTAIMAGSGLVVDSVWRWRT